DRDVLDRLRPPREDHLSRTERLRILEVGPNARVQPLGLADVQELPVPVAEQVDPGLSRESGDRLLQVRLGCVVGGIRGESIAAAFRESRCHSGEYSTPASLDRASEVP